jgi:Domain of unknown function (DUF1911)
MTEEAFRANRRQKFLTEKYYKLNLAFSDLMLEAGMEGLVNARAMGKVDSVSEGSLFKDKLSLLELHYTAGEPIESLKPLYADAMRWFARWHRAHEEYRAFISKDDAEKIRLDISPVHFEDLFHFEIALDVVSLGLLLGEGDKVREAVAWMESERGTDMLFEALVESVVSDPRDVDEFFHEEPYDPLLDAIYTADTPEEASAYVKKYLDGWYKAFDGVPWHNGHLVATDEYMAYEGYWAFEAAAVCVIHGIDDSSFRDHLVYPKDLADWARANQSLEKVKPGANAHALRLRCEGGEPCPQAGFWFTPAKQNSRRSFASGEKMPSFKDSPWGATIWYWDERQ